jgi:hypothetical protein
VNVPLDGPAHDVVTANHGGEPEEDLTLGTAESVEDGGMNGTSPGVLSVGGQTVGDNTTLLLTT